MSAELVPALSPAEARALTDRIAVSYTTFHEAIITAFHGRAWIALGYPTWADYCSAEFAHLQTLRLPPELRQPAVETMHAEGMSIRAIASGMGISVGTVHGDIDRSEMNSRPATVTSLDGRVRPASQLQRDPMPAPAPEPTRRPSRRALPDAYFDAMFDLAKAAERIARLHEDDRFPRHAEPIATKHHGDMTRIMHIVVAAEITLYDAKSPRDGGDS